MSDNRKDSRHKITDAALKLFTEQGIKSTTTKAIAAKAGVAEGTIYIHFKSKDELAYTLFLENMNNFREFLLKSVDESSAPSKNLDSLVVSFYKFAKDEPVKYQFIIVGHHTELKKMPPLKSKPKDAIVSVIKEGIKKGDFRKTDPNLAAAYVIGMITRSIMFHKQGFIKQSYEQVVSETRESVRKLLSG